MTFFSELASRLSQKFGSADTDDHLDVLLSNAGVSLALDIGCGITSRLTRFRPRIKTVGLDAYTITEATKSNAHDHYISANITDIPLEKVQNELQAVYGRCTVDLVTLFGVIEHLPKSEGWKLIDKIEQISERYILIDTPNGFVPQGPEYGNPYQRHLSGWFPHEFEGYGYSVYGGLGTCYLRGYMGEPRFNIPGLRLFDNVIMARVLMTQRFPHHAFNICAIKDVRGVPARYTSYNDPNRL